MLRNVFKPYPSNYKNKSIIISQLIEKKSYKFVHLLGYVILIFMGIDYLSLLIFPQLSNPNWRLETIGNVIETIYITLLGFLLIFFRSQKYSVKQRELKILSFLSRLILVLGIICFAFAPLLISNSWKIHGTNYTNIDYQLDLQHQ